MPAPTPEKHAELCQRRATVAELYLSGMTQANIGRKLNVCQQQVSADLAHCRREWMAYRLLDMDAIKADALARIDRAELMANDGWERSLAIAETRRTRQQGTAGKQTEYVERGQGGNPRYIELILRCMRERCELLGVYEVRPDDARDDGAPEPGELSVEDFKRLSPQEQIRVMAERFRKWTGARARSKPVDLLTGPLPAQGDEGTAGAENAPLA